MKWNRGAESADVEDRRGNRGVKIAGGSIGAALVLALISQVLGVDVSGLFGSSGGGGGAEEPAKGGEKTEEYHFANAVLDDIQATFEQVFKREGKKYRHAKLVLFTDEVGSGCGRSSAAVGPFYCPPDEKAYIDLSFFRVLSQRLGAGGDFAAAYVLAHEIGHHVQKLLGTSNERDSVRVELQADCYAGVWAHSTKERGVVENGDIEEAVNAAAQIGDDRLQEMAGQEVNPETFTHGSSAQRARWFKIGLSEGTLGACDTFSRDL
jgi:predicted metalloprotease